MTNFGIPSEHIHIDADLFLYINFKKIFISRDSLFKVCGIFVELFLPDFKKSLQVEIRRFSTGQCELGGEK